MLAVYNDYIHLGQLLHLCETSAFYFLFLLPPFLLCPLESSFRSTLISLTGDTITSQSAHLLLQTLWGLGLQLKHYGGAQTHPLHFVAFEISGVFPEKLETEFYIWFWVSALESGSVQMLLLAYLILEQLMRPQYSHLWNEDDYGDLMW